MRVREKVRQRKRNREEQTDTERIGHRKKIKEIKMSLKTKNESEKKERTISGGYVKDGDRRK